MQGKHATFLIFEIQFFVLIYEVMFAHYIQYINREWYAAE